MVKELKLSDIEIEGTVRQFRLAQKQNALYLKESIKNKTLLFQDYSKEQLQAIEKFIDWYFN